MQSSCRPQIKRPPMLVFAGDHGVVTQGVSSFPQSVTIAMLANFVNGGAAVATLCKQQGIQLSVINCGTAESCEHLTQIRSEEHTSELQSRFDLVCRLLLEKKKTH